MEEDFLKENGHLLSRFEEVQGNILRLKSLHKGQKSKIDGLEYDLHERNREVDRLLNVNKTLRAKLGVLEEKITEQNQLVPQNFKIRNNLVKIVSDIEDKESEQEISLKDYLDALIEEIDLCINQLSK